MANIPTRTNNPGDLRFVGQSGAQQDPSGFASFPNAKTGMAALLNDIQSKINRNPDGTLADFGKEYAPPTENNTAQYVANLANRMGVRPDSKLRDLQSKIGEFADAISGNEGFQQDTSNLPGVGALGAQIEAQNQPQYPSLLNSPPQQLTQQPISSGSFSSPLQNIQQGNEDANVDVAKGAVKGGLQVIRDVSGVDTNPVVKSMLDNAPAFAQNVDAEKKAIMPSNANQQQGFQDSQLAANIIPIGGGAKVAKEAGGLLSASLTGSKDAVLDAVKPRLTPTVAANTKTQTVGLLNKIVPTATNQVKKVAEAVRPYFNPKATWSTNAQAADTAIAHEAHNLESLIDKVNHPIVLKELGARLSNAEEPISLKGTSFEKQIAPLKQAAVDLTKKSGGTVKGTFQALRQFDNLVDKTWPTLWDKENAPMRNAVTAIRNEWKNFIAENLPDEKVYRDSLEEQTHLYDARDTFREKAALGEKQTAGEIGTTGPGRFLDRHPGLVGATKWAGGAAVTGLLGGEIAGHVLNNK